MTLVQRLLRRRGTGYLSDPADHRDRDFDGLGLSRAQLPGVSLRPHVLSVLDQGPTNSCVAQSVAQALRIQSSVNGSPEALRSRSAIYWNSRAYHGATRRDRGTHIRHAIKALQKFGAPSEGVWPFVPNQVNKRPPPAAYQNGFDARGVRGYYRIFDAGEAKLLAVKAALAAGRPVVAGWMIDRAFMDDDGPSIITPPVGPIVGGHAMVIIGYTGDFFEIVNSWGGWRDGGFARFTSEFVARAIDVWAIDTGAFDEN